MKTKIEMSIEEKHVNVIYSSNIEMMHLMRRWKRKKKFIDYCMGYK